MNKFLALLLILVFGCGDDDGVMDADVMTVDSSLMDAASADQGTDVTDEDASIPDAALDAALDADLPNCGTSRVAVDMVSGTEGLAVGEDGTLYFSQSGGIGRVSPNGTVTSNWITGLGSTMWGLAFRDSDKTLFAASPNDGGVIYQVDTTQATPQARNFIANAGAPNGLIVAADGSLFYSNFNGSAVVRVSVEGIPQTVNTSPISQPNGVFLDDDGSLLVLSYNSGSIWRLTLDAQFKETSRMEQVMVAFSPDGIAKDDMNRYYISDNSGGGLVRFDSDFSNPEQLLTNVSAAANIVFGRGVLDCTDIYLSSRNQLRVLNVAAGGRP